MQSAKLLKLAMLVDIVKQVISVTPVRRVNSANIVKPVDTREGGGDICRTACTGLVMGRRTLTHGEAPV